jgi:hypothetical protein
VNESFHFNVSYKCNSCFIYVAESLAYNIVTTYSVRDLLTFNSELLSSYQIPKNLNNEMCVTVIEPVVLSECKT